jgi:hypothetical protein
LDELTIYTPEKLMKKKLRVALPIQADFGVKFLRKYIAGLELILIFYNIIKLKPYIP